MLGKLDEALNYLPENQRKYVTFRIHQHMNVPINDLGCTPNPLDVFVSLTSEHLPMFNQSLLTSVRVGVT